MFSYCFNRIFLRFVKFSNKSKIILLLLFSPYICTQINLIIKK